MGILMLAISTTVIFSLESMIILVFTMLLILLPDSYTRVNSVYFWIGVKIFYVHYFLMTLPRFILLWIAHCSNIGKVNTFSRWCLAYFFVVTTVVLGLLQVMVTVNTYLAR